MLKVIKEHRGYKDFREIKVYKDFRVIKVYKVFKVIKDYRDYKDVKVKMETLVVLLLIIHLQHLLLEIQEQVS